MRIRKINPNSKASIKDLVGYKCGESEVIALNNYGENGLPSWKLRCSCGDEFIGGHYAILKDGAKLYCPICRCNNGKRPVELVGMVTTSGSQCVELIEKGKANDQNRWMMICICGKKFKSKERTIRKNKVKLLCPSCKTKVAGNSKTKDLLGKTFDRLFVVSKAESSSNGATRWNCECQCKDKTKTIVNSSALIGGKTRSCGCIGKEIAAKRFREIHAKNRPDGLECVKEYRKRESISSFRLYIYKRDNNACVLCNNKKGLNAHHMDSWQLSLDRRYDETNLVCLCKACHVEFHRIYGKGYTTQKQFEEYCDIRGIDFICLIEKIKRYQNDNRYILWSEIGERIYQQDVFLPKFIEEFFY